MRRATRAGWADGVAAVAIAIMGFAATALAQPGITLEAGDIVVLDISNDSVEHVDPDTGVKTTLASGSAVRSARGVAFSPEGFVYVSDTGNEWVVRIDPDSGEIVFVAFVSATGFPDPAAMIADEDSDWDLLLVEADERKIVRIDPVTGVTSLEFALTGTRFPIGLARDPTDKTLIVADRFADTPGENPGVHRVDVANGFQTAVSLRSEYKSLRRVGVQSNGDIILSEHDDALIFRIPAVPPDPQNPDVPEEFGSCGSSFIGPSGVAVDPTGTVGDTLDTVLVTDRDTGALHRLDADGNGCTLINGSFNGPWDVAVVPALTPRNHDRFLVAEVDGGTGANEVHVADSATNTRSAVNSDGPLSVFTQPIAMAWTKPDATLATGEIYVIDGDSSIVRRNLATGVQTPVPGPGPDDPLNEFDILSDIAVDFDGDIIVTDIADGQVIRVIMTPEGEEELGDHDVITDALGEPTDLVIDAGGTLIVTDRAPVGDVPENENDSGLFRVNPLNGAVEQFVAKDLLSGGNIEFNDPIALARDPRTGLLLLDAGDPLKPAKIYRILDSEGTLPLVRAFALATSVDASLDTATALAVDGNRDPIVGFANLEPQRIEPLTGTGTTLTVGGSFDELTDLLIEGMPAPGNPTDSDGDLIPDRFDNCPTIANTNQLDSNFDGQGDVCQLFDLDFDGFPDGQDNCPLRANPERTCLQGLVGASCLADDDCDDPGASLCENDVCTAGLIGEPCTVDAECDDPTTGVCGAVQFDADDDGWGEVCDNCPADPNNQADFDGNGVGDVCDDSDGDGTGSDDVDNCPGVVNPGQEDGDNDGVGDVCDNCPTNGNSDQSDVNEDEVGDVCQGSDTDNDGWPDVEDNCPNDFNPSQSNANAVNETGLGTGDACQPNDEGDHDGWPVDGSPEDDNCPNTPNPNQYDSNGDGEGDVCQSNDADLDGWPESGPGILDNCPETFNPSADADGDGEDDGQSDVNDDGIGDACQPNDLDNDGRPDDEDNCPNDFNPSQSNVNAAAEAIFGLDIGDACEPDDVDGDGWPGGSDNCPFYPNVDQDDWNGDGTGDLCQNSDGDEWIDFLDNCRSVTNPSQADADADGIGNACDPDFVPLVPALSRPGRALLFGLLLVGAGLVVRRRGGARAAR